MGQQEYDAFKERMKHWMLDNADAYDEFEEIMNSQSDAGYQKIMAQAMALVPRYEKAISQKMNRSSLDDTADIEELFADENIGAKLVGQFDGIDKESVVPAMLCWLFFGRSFENMVERGEEIMNNPNINRFQSFIIAQTTKILIKKSINLKLRTKEDWNEYYDLRKIIDNDKVMEWALETDGQPDGNKKSGRPSTASPLVQMFTSTAPKKLAEKIGDYLTTKHSQSDIARLKIALDELRFLVSPVNIKPFRDALAGQFCPGIHIVHERGIQEAYSRLTSTVPARGKQIADIGEDRIAIEKLKDFLRR